MELGLPVAQAAKCDILGTERNESFRFRQLRDPRSAQWQQRTQLDLVRIDRFAGNTLRALRLFLSDTFRAYGSGVRPERADAHVQGQEYHRIEPRQEQRRSNKSSGETEP